MAPSRFVFALVLLLVVGISWSSGKAHQQSQNDDTLYFRSNLNHNDVNESDTEDDLYLGKELGENNDGPAQPKPNNWILQVPWWSTFLLNLITHFHPQRPPNRSQFGVLFLGNVNQNLHNQNFPVTFHPSTSQGGPVINNANQFSPANVNQYNNYVAARPENVQGTMIHAEAAILGRTNILWNAYVNQHGHPPNFMLLYSWIMPCPDCTNQIIDHFSQAPFTNVENRVVAYTVEGTGSGLPYMTPAGNQNSRQRLVNNNITVWREKCNRPDLSVVRSDVGNDEDMCLLADTFQGCMVGCLGNDLCCSCKHDKKWSMNAATVNDLAKACAASNVVDCSRNWVQSAFSPKRSGASSCTDIDIVRQKILTCVNTCVDHPLSKPLEPNRPYYNPGYLTTFSDISVYPSVDLTNFCEDVRAEGYYCTNYRADSFTAGNTLCRSGQRCDYRGQKYSWCYVDFSNNWDYCCTSSCGFGQSTSYMWCYSGNTWQYCGDAGEEDIKDRRCLAEFPCGMHQEDGKESYYWCYVDVKKNWDRCCQPSDTCSKKGESYNWCYTGYKKDTNWQYCTI